MAGSDCVYGVGELFNHYLGGAGAGLHKVASGRHGGVEIALGGGDNSACHIAYGNVETVGAGNGDDACTACDGADFWSHRLLGNRRGSMAAMIQLL